MIAKLKVKHSVINNIIVVSLCIKFNGETRIGGGGGAGSPTPEEEAKIYHLARFYRILHENKNAFQ